MIINSFTFAIKLDDGMSMERQYSNSKERIEAFKRAVAMRQKWIQAIRDGVSREQMEQMGLFMPKIVKE